MTAVLGSVTATFSSVLVAQADDSMRMPVWTFAILAVVVLVLLTVLGVSITLLILLSRRSNRVAMPHVTAVPTSGFREGAPPMLPEPAAFVQPAKNCPTCGYELSASAPQGLCPRCLLQGGMSDRAVDPVPAAPNGTAPYQGPAHVPTPDELAIHFPQLEILELLGQGGMGAVYKARQTKLDRLVALKVLPAAAGADPAFAERFAREARALAKLSHPGIVTLHDFGEAGGLFYFIMEYVDGLNLRQLMKSGHLPPAEALKLVPQICEALQYAHDTGVVHRDVKPENILVDRRGQVKIADFGLAKLLGKSADYQLTGTQQVMGTPHYMAPEQMDRPLTVDHRADIYSLGVVFYELLTGELPLGRFAPPSQKAGVDARLDEVVMRALEPDPQRRYQHASEVRTALASLANAPAAPPVEYRTGLNVFATRVEQILGVRTDVNNLALDVVSVLGIALALGLLGWGIWFTNTGWFVFGLPVLAKIVRQIPVSAPTRLILFFVFLLGGMGLFIVAIHWWWMCLPACFIAYDDVIATLPPTGQRQRGGPARRSIAESEEDAAVAAASLSPQEQELLRVLRRQQTECSFYLLEEIPAEALHMARDKCQVPPVERILAYLDFSGEEEGEISLLVGGRGIYVRDAKKNVLAIPFEEFPERTFVNHGKVVYLGHDQFLDPDIDTSAIGCEEIANLLNALRGWALARKAAPGPAVT